MRDSPEPDDTSGMGAAAIDPGPREEAQKCKDSIEAIKQRAGTSVYFLYWHKSTKLTQLSVTLPAEAFALYNEDLRAQIRGLMEQVGQILSSTSIVLLLG